VILSTEIRGANIGHIYLFVGYIDEAANSIYVADKDYLDSGADRVLGGRYYPDWEHDGALSLEFEWEPVVFAIDDGGEAVTALFTPEDYGASPSQAVYTVAGTYAFTDGTEPRRALLYFTGDPVEGEGVLKKVYGFTDPDAGAPREIIPEPGDTFTVHEKWIDLGAGGAVVGQASQDGGSITFGDAEVYWVEQWAAAGPYIVGIIVEDMDGNAYAAYTSMRVE
jgi:hypothetical protein